MPDGYKLLTRLLVGVLKHQVKRYLGEDVVAALAEAGSEHLGDELLSLLKGEESSHERAERILSAIQSAADEIDRMQLGNPTFVLDDAPLEIVDEVVESLANLETDLFGNRLQTAISNLVAGTVRLEPPDSFRLGIKLYQTVLLAVLPIPELQVRAQDLLAQTRMWVLTEHMRRIEQMTKPQPQLPPADSTVDSTDSSVRSDQARLPGPSHPLDGEKEQTLDIGRLVAKGKIELIRQIGKGAQAEVWQGRIIASNERVAIRFLNVDLSSHPEILQSFKREAEVLSRIPGGIASNLIQAPTFENGRYFYVLDYVQSLGTFQDVINDSKIPIEKKLRLLLSLADTLNTLHENGIVHCDIKPQNVLVEAIDGGIRLIDFGAVRRIGDQEADEPVTFTYAYAPPELIQGARGRDELQSIRVQAQIRMHVGPWVDIYPLGIMLFQALDPGLGQIARMEEYWLIDRLLVSSDLKDVIRTTIAREPANRYQTALDFKSALESAMSRTSSSRSVE